MLEVGTFEGICLPLILPSAEISEGYPKRSSPLLALVSRRLKTSRNNIESRLVGAIHLPAIKHWSSELRGL